VVRGRSAHAGRTFASGRSAIVAAAELVGWLDALNRERPGVCVNIGKIDGGGPVNVVPDLSLVRFNVRVADAEAMEWVRPRLDALITRLAARDGIRAELRGEFRSPPKPVDPPTQRLLEHVADCGSRLGLDVRWKATGGVCDGNKLAAAGLPNVDTLGVRGGAIHSDREYLLIDSLTERAKLTALLLMRLAAGELDWPAQTASASMKEHP
jgi:glutamate carboxypeptidase